MIPGGIILQAQPSDPGAIFGLIVAIVGAVFVAIALRSIRKKQGRSFRSAGAAAKPAATSSPAPFIRTTHPVISPRGASAAAGRALSPIDSIRQLMGPAPRTFDGGLASYLEVLPPKWLDKNPKDEQWINVKNQDRLRRDGLVVWSTYVQANNNLFKKINNESGASVIYSADPWFDRNPAALRIIGRQCFALKGTDPADPESAAFARMLTNEMTRAMRLKVPSAFTGGREVFHSSMLMPRKHLPKGILSGAFFPVWMDRQATGAVVMVPAAYWPASLTAEWDREG